MSFWWEQNIESCLFDPESLLQILPYMCKIEAEDKRAAEKYDPITRTVVTFLTCPLQLGLTEVGAMLFQGRSTLIYPYTLMNDAQKAFVRQCLDHRAEWNLYNDCIVFKRHRGAQGKTLGAPAVLVALCSKIFQSPAHEDPRRRVALCNIILQRVQGYIPIDKPVQRHLNEWLQARHAAQAVNPAAQDISAHAEKAQHQQAVNSAAQDINAPTKNTQQQQGNTDECRPKKSSKSR